jgi:hypothetical protein
VTEVHEGGCLCGAVRFRAEGAPTNVNHCHCRMCQRASGAPVVTWATFPMSRFKWTNGAPTIRRSSDIAVRGFCGACGTALLWQDDAHADMIDITAGTLDKPEAVAPREHLWTESAVPWLPIDDTLPRHRRSRGTS